MDRPAPSRNAEDTAYNDLREMKDNSERVIEIDWRCYEALLNDTQLDDTQKQEFIEALWSILVFLWGGGYSTPPATHPDDER